MKEQLLRAALAQFESTALVARANLEVYLCSPVGVSDHPDIVTDIASITKTITEAEDNIRTLEGLIGNALLAESSD